MNKFNTFGIHATELEASTKLNNFMALNPIGEPLRRNKTEVAVNDVDSNNYEEDDYEDDFESLSKSQAGLSMSKVSLKNNSRKDIGQEDNESESVSESTITCFLCKKQIPKSQALSHSNNCKKMGGLQKNKGSNSDRKNTEESQARKNYSPIKEIESEEEKYTNSEHYSSSKFEESSSRTGKHKSTEELKKGGKIDKGKGAKDPMRESYLSSSMSNEKPI